jgi:hypothetical protein
MPSLEESAEPARWVELRSPDPDHPCYTRHTAWATQLAAGYAAARAVYDTEATEDPLSAYDAQLMRESTIVIPAGQLCEWVLDDLQDRTTQTRR